MPTPLACRNSMISRMTFWSAQPATTRLAYPRSPPAAAPAPARSGRTRLAERRHQGLDVNLADAADHAQAQIILDPLQRHRLGGEDAGRLELQPVLVVVDPTTGGADELAGVDDSGVADHHDKVTLPAVCFRSAGSSARHWRGRRTLPLTANHTQPPTPLALAAITVFLMATYEQAGSWLASSWPITGIKFVSTVQTLSRPLRLWPAAPCRRRSWSSGFNNA